MDTKKIDAVCAAAKAASRELANCTADRKNAFLFAIADALIARKKEILVANQADVDICRKPEQFIDRLRLTSERVEAMAEGVRQVAALNDPVGEVLGDWVNADGLRIRRIRVPFGVVGIIYEARPNVTIDTAALCIKSGNAVVLRGSKDALESNRMLVQVAQDAIRAAGFNPDCVRLIEDVTHEGAAYFMTKREYVDVLVPRGSGALIRSTMENASIPVIETGVGNCHIYIDCNADVDMAKRILINAKCQRTSICNACESVLIHEALADRIPEILSGLSEAGVVIHGCEITRAKFPEAVPATEQDYEQEYLGMEISCKVVVNVEEAIAHINRYGTHHSDAIVTQDADVARRFQQEVDSAAVYHNASTRFTDGFVFGFGAELGISTQKMHARGPIGLKELTSYKYVIDGNGQVR